MNLLGLEGEFVEVTKRIQKVFNDMANTFTRRQKDEIEKRKFTFLEKDQLKEVYSKQGLVVMCSPFSSLISYRTTGRTS